MGNLFSQQCDLCPKIQTSANPSEIKGTMFSINGASRFACSECKSILDAAFSVGSEGLRDPILALAKVTKERDQLMRLLEQAKFQREVGTASLVGVEFDHHRMQASNHKLTGAPALGGGIQIHKIGHHPVEEPQEKSSSPKSKKKTRTVK